MDNVNQLHSDDPQRIEIEKRQADTLAEMHKNLEVIFSKGHEVLTRDDKGFLQARREYLSHATLEEYAAELAEDLNKDATAQDGGLESLTRNELNEKALQAGVETPEKLPSKQAVIDAMLALQ